MLENCETLNNQAILYAQKGEYAEAIACFKRALNIEKQNYLLWYNLGLTYRDAGDLKKAKHAIKQANEINPTDQEVLESLSHICFIAGDFNEALYYCSQGLSINSYNPHFWNLNGVVLFNQTEYEMAAESFERAVSLNPYYSDALFNLKDCYEELGNKAGAQICREKLNSLH